MAKAKASSKRYPCHCNQCGYDWESRIKHPKHCACCISDKWDKPLEGKKLRKAVPSRMRLKERKKLAVRNGVKKAVTVKEPKVKAPRVKRTAPGDLRAPRRVKKEKSAPAAPVEQTDVE